MTAKKTMTLSEVLAEAANELPLTPPQEVEKKADLVYDMVFEVGSTREFVDVETNGDQVYITFTERDTMGEGRETTLMLTKANLRGHILGLKRSPNLFQQFGANGLTMTLGLSKLWAGVPKHVESLSVSLRTGKGQEVGEDNLPLIRVLDALV